MATLAMCGKPHHLLQVLSENQLVNDVIEDLIKRQHRLLLHDILLK